MYQVMAIYGYPVHYTAPMFKQMSNDSEIDLNVVYCKTAEYDQPSYDNDGNMVIGNIKVLDGYKYHFLKELIHAKTPAPQKLINPEVQSYIKQQKPDAIIVGISYWSPTTWFTIKEARKWKIPLITRATVEKGRNRNTALKIIKKVVVGKYCRMMTSGIYESEEQRNYLIEYGMDSQSLYMCPCAVDNEYFQHLAERYDRKEARNRLNVSDDDTIVIAFVGALSERKRPMDLIRAVEKLQNQGMDIVTLLIGKGDKRDEIEEYICTHHIKDVQMCGFVKQEKLSEYLVATDLYVLPSLNDASPKALNEAMNFSLPIIVSDGVETANEMLNEGENGYLFRAGDVEDLKNKIEDAIMSKRLKEMGKKSKEIVEKSGYAEMIEGWKNAIKYALHTK